MRAKLRKAGNALIRSAPVQHALWRANSSLENVFHCCVQKTASQWVRKILSSREVYLATGLAPFRYGHDPRPLDKRNFESPFPEKTVVSPLYVGYESYLSIPKPYQAAAFFVGRDPRDIVVSWYYSARYSHKPIGPIVEHRRNLERLSKTRGLVYSIEALQATGVWAALESWTQARSDESVRLTSFERLTARSGIEEWSSLFHHLSIDISGSKLKRLLELNSFEALAGRARGEVDHTSHFRSGTPGDWRHHFDDNLEQFFREKTGKGLAKWYYATV